MSEKINHISEDINSFSLPQHTPVSVTRISRHNRKSELLINSTDPSKNLKPRNQKYFIDFTSPMFVHSIELKGDGIPSYKKMEFGWVDSYQNEKSVQVKSSSNGLFRATVDGIIGRFYFKPPKRHFNDPSITSIRITGLSIYEFNKVCEKLGDLENLRTALNEEVEKALAAKRDSEAEVEAGKERKRVLQHEIASLKEQHEALESNKEDKEAEVAELDNEIEQKKTDVSNIETQERELKDSIDQKENQRNALNSDVAQCQRELRKLKEDINLFPSEISGFVSQGARNILRYTVLAIIPLLLLAIYTWALFSGAADLTRIYAIPDYLPDDFDLLALILSRVPFALISIFVIHAAYKISKMFILEVIKINRQRLNLSKISIVAKDVSDASASGLGFSDDEIYELRTKLKMGLLKSHLSGYLDEDYDYDIDIGLWDKFLERRGESNAGAGAD